MARWWCVASTEPLLLRRIIAGLMLVLLALAALVGAGVLAASALKDRAAYFYTPAEARAASVEPGRAISGPPGTALYTVGTTKDVELGGGLSRRYVSVDGGMSDNIRPALYAAEYSAVLANRTSDAAPTLSRVVGLHCEGGDILVRDVFLPADTGVGDLVAVPASGAYSRSMASNYNHTPRPPVVSVRDGRLTTVIRRETLDDILALDAGLDGPAEA